MLEIVKTIVRQFRPENPTLYFHSPCFDGIASAVLALDFLETQAGWKRVQLRSVNYDLRSTWATTRLTRKAAVVDFLYHPGARFWADHHPTTFANGEPTSTAERGGSLTAFDPNAPSCALLIQRVLGERYAYRNTDYEPLVSWATKVDAARYESVDEALFGDAPALRISTALLVGGSGYPEYLVRALRQASLDDVAAQSETNAYFRDASDRLRQGLEHVRQSVKIDAYGIVTFDVVKERGLVHRYSPYHFFPNGLYSLGIVRSLERVTVTGMRNPWVPFESVHLGQLFKSFGGGGHQRVASVAFTGDNRDERASKAIEAIVDAIRGSLAAHDTSALKTAALHAL